MPPGGMTELLAKAPDVKHVISLITVLFITWILLSGYFTPLLLAFGIISCVVTALIAVRMDVVDHEGHPIHLRFRVITYWFWLMKEIVIANIDVAKRILSPKLGISPTMRSVASSQATDLGRVILANSITLTPGTISIRVAPNEILVHALSREGMEGLESGDMDRRVSAVEGHR